MKNGFFLVHRALFEKQWFQDLGTRQIVVFHILARASWNGNRLSDGRELEPGQLVLGLHEFAKECALSFQQVRTILDGLERVKFVTRGVARKGTRNGTLLTVVNWHTYQFPEDADNKEGNKEDNKRATTINKVTNNIITNVDFERLWSMYPRRDGKKAAERHFNASVKTEADVMGLEKAIRNYIRYLETNRIESRFIKQGSTFFNNWRDWEFWQAPVVNKGVVL